MGFQFGRVRMIKHAKMSLARRAQKTAARGFSLHGAALGLANFAHKAAYPDQGATALRSQAIDITHLICGTPLAAKPCECGCPPLSR